MKRKIIVVAILFTIISIGLTYGLFLVSKSRTFQFFGEIINRVDTDEKVVALTFDDAPTKRTGEVLKTLQQKGIKATFYMIGQSLEEFPDEGKQIADQGNELGNHSYSHQRFYFKSQSFIDGEIQKTNNLIRKTGYTGEITFRAPNTKKLFGLPWYLSQHNIKTITDDVEPDTYSGNLNESKEKTDFLISYTTSHVSPGSIILLHPFCDTCRSDRDAIGIIIDELRLKGYRFVTISELLKSRKQTI